ncbi:MAG: hypothetical protein H7Z43_04420 [Clostridia bacterium]|nr:hypothetical protein [Deltaproteobacteria bacterium]
MKVFAFAIALLAACGDETTVCTSTGCYLQASVIVQDVHGAPLGDFSASVTMDDVTNVIACPGPSQGSEGILGSLSCTTNGISVVLNNSVIQSFTIAVTAENGKSCARSDGNAIYEKDRSDYSCGRCEAPTNLPTALTVGPC